ncbi:glycosyltransferase family 2 protein [Mucilaginibacter sp. SP1R1]|uniref:glycosyltransferase family 2 protein n=1 Tax=Mucilaginibacter sp. SP1R1 TaxID=2723091 RepID=UPI00161DA254|nr:glycosyltransferase family 2 protein [Mucilaginibacter sp. SP1R1]MBB6149559.1 glycosyltransferase involved in cell wall biosynthesis [Mucilaginibacter sp. SP1R1]
MSYPLVSFIIPVYNHQNYVAYTLNSICDDDYPNKEIVIVNDGSTDNSDKVITEWIAVNAGKISVNYVNRENKGICSALNELVKLSKGKYIIIVASDDMLYGSTVTRRVNILEENEKTGKFVLISDALIIDENNNVSQQSSMENNKGNKQKFKTDRGILEEMITKPSTVGAISIINKSIYDKIGPYPEDLYLEDWFFYQRAAALKSIIFWDEVVSLYRVHSSNMSGVNISMKRRLDILRSVKTSVSRNISWFPSVYYKFLGVRKLISLYYLIFKLKVKGVIVKET